MCVCRCETVRDGAGVHGCTVRTESVKVAKARRFHAIEN